MKKIILTCVIAFAVCFTSVFSVFTGATNNQINQTSGIFYYYGPDDPPTM